MTRHKNDPMTRVGLIFPFSIGIGVSIGALLHNIGAGIAIGSAVGVVLTLILHQLFSTKADQS